RSVPASARPTGGRRCPAAPLPHQCPRSTVPRSSSYGSLPARPCTMRALVAQATVRALGGRDVTTLAHPRPLTTQGSSGLPRPTLWRLRSSAALNRGTGGPPRLAPSPCPSPPEGGKEGEWSAPRRFPQASPSAAAPGGSTGFGPASSPTGGPATRA